MSLSLVLSGVIIFCMRTVSTNTLSTLPPAMLDD